MKINAQTLGCTEFKKKHSLQYAYVAGGMYRGVASKEMVVRMANAGFLSFFGSGGFKLHEIEEAIEYIKKHSVKDSVFGINFLHNHFVSEKDDEIIDLLLKHEIHNIEAAAFAGANESLVRYKLSGISVQNGEIIQNNRIMAKVSRLETARQFLMPASDEIIETLLKENKITNEQAEIGRRIPIADDICMEADSAGHTDRKVAMVMIPALIKLRDKIQKENNYTQKVCVGAAGGIGTPEAAAAAFIMGADFILTGSINQCSVESGTNPLVKELLSKMGVEDTDYCPTGDMFENGSLIQVLKKGTLFPIRAKTLLDIYKKFDSLEDISHELVEELEKKFYGRTIEEVFADAKKVFPSEIMEKVENDPKLKLSMILRMYFYYTIGYSFKGERKNKINFQVHTGNALGGFNQLVKNTELDDWNNRHVDTIATFLMESTAKYLTNQIKNITNGFSIN